MVTRRIIKNERANRIKSVNQGASYFTDFFDERHSMNENPTAPFHQFMNDHEIDFHKGEVRRVRK